jgi:glycosyltransferase involved in cell wall biosynthesis
MRVLYVDHTSLVSGAQWALLDLIAGLPEGVEPVIMCPPGPLADMAVSLGASHVGFPGTSAGLRLHPVYTTRAMVDAVRSIRAIRWAGARGIDVVHANSMRAGLLAARARREGSPPLVVHIHDVLPPGRTAAFVRRALHRGADAAITISEHTTRNYSGSDGRARVHVLYNPLDVHRFDPARMDRAEARRRLGFDPDAPLVGLIAQITPWKGHDLAIRAIAEVRRAHPRARLLIAGESKFVERTTRYDNRRFERDLRTIVRDLGLRDHVEFLGEVRDVAVLIRALDVSVAPSWEEPFGRSVMESMALETYTIATAVGGPREFLEDGVDGRTLDPHDAGAWAGAIGAALADPEHRAEVGRRASEKVRRRFDRARYVERVVALYESLIAR